MQDFESLAMVAQLAPIGMAINDLKRGTIWMNDFYYNLLGLTPPKLGESHKVQMLELLHEEDQILFTDAYRNLMMGQEFYHGIARLRHTEGHYLTLWGSTIAFKKDKEGRPQQFLSTAIQGFEELLEPFFKKRLAMLNSNASNGLELETNPMTKRERLILQMLATNQTSKKVAESLSLSPYTIETHRKNILQKLQVNTTGAAIALAKEKHWI
jgi:DNA-binding CsgD family transcriptional regulator